MKRLLIPLVCGVLLAVCCGCMSAARQDTYQIYYAEVNLASAVGSDALRETPVLLRNSDSHSTEELARALLEKLMEKPVEDSLRSVIPEGTSLLSLTVSKGRATVDLSGRYGNLSGVALTLADYAITLTLTQLEEISSVKITVAGQELDYREKQVFYVRDVLLSPKEDVVGTVLVQLYFPNQEGVLIAEERQLELYEGDSQIGAVARALEMGPENRDLLPVFPEGFRVNALWLEEMVCYVNLSSVLLDYLPVSPEDSGQVLDAIRKSLCSLESVREVRFLVDGGFCAENVIHGSPL